METIPDDFKLIFESKPSNEFDTFANDFINDYEKIKEEEIEEETIEGE